MLGRLFGRIPPLKPYHEEPSALPVADVSVRHELHHGTKIEDNRDVLAGWRFCATMQLRTPFRVLSRHGELHEDLATEPAIIALEQWEGIWLQRTKSFRDLGIDLDEIATTMASDIGQVPQDGGDYLPFLLALRKAAESSGTVKERRAATAAVAREAAYKKFVSAHGGQGKLLDKLFPPFTSTIPRLSSATAKALDQAGLHSPDKIARASDQSLRSIEGVGPATVKTLRAAVENAEGLGERYVDRVSK